MDRWRIVPPLYQPTVLLLNTIPSILVDSCRLHLFFCLQNAKTGLGVVSMGFWRGAVTIL